MAPLLFSEPISIFYGGTRFLNAPDLKSGIKTFVYDRSPGIRLIETEWERIVDWINAEILPSRCAEIILVWLVVFTVSFYVFLYWRKFDYAGILLGIIVATIQCCIYAELGIAGFKLAVLIVVIVMVSYSPDTSLASGIVALGTALVFWLTGMRVYLN